MPKRTSPQDAHDITQADYLQHAVHDKREGWRANPTKARRRQRRYTGLLTRELLTRRAAQPTKAGFWRKSKKGVRRPGPGPRRGYPPGNGAHPPLSLAQRYHRAAPPKRPAPARHASVKFSNRSSVTNRCPMARAEP
jgi:hypothetical protein